MRKIWLLCALTIPFAAVTAHAGDEVFKSQYTGGLPVWEPFDSGFTDWIAVTWTDEAGQPRVAQCYYKNCGKDVKDGKSRLYVLKSAKSEKINSDGGTRQTYDSQLLLYELVIKGGKVTLFKPGTTFSTEPRLNWHAQYISAPGSNMRVLPPKMWAEDTAAELIAAKEKAAQEKAEQERLAKKKAAQEKAEQERLAKKKAAQEKAEQERLAKEKAAQEKAEQERLAEEKAEQERLAEEERKRKEHGEPALGKFEKMVLTADMSKEEKAQFEADYRAATQNPDREKYNKFIIAARAEVMKKVQAYVHPGWKPKDPNAAKVWNRFDPIEQAYIEQRLAEIGPKAKATFDAQLEEAQKALKKGDPKKADSVVSLYRSMIKHDLQLYAGQAGGAKLTAKEQLDKMQELFAKLEGETDIEKARQTLDEAVHGKGSDKTVDGTGKGKDDAEADQKINTGDLANNPDPKGKGKITVPPLGKDEPNPEKKDDTMQTVKEVLTIGIMAGFFAFIAAIFFGPVGIVVAGLAGAGLGYLYNKQNE